MALSSEFSELEHLQMLIRRYINKQVREDFQDLGSENWEPDVSTTRGAMRHALTHKDADPLQVTLLRMFLYYFTFGKAAALQPGFYGIPIQSFDVQRKYKPQITLYFNDGGYNDKQLYERVEGEISFRLMDQTSTTISRTDVERYANKVKQLFILPTRFIWHKGKVMVSYTDRDKGYQLQLLVRDEAEGRRLIEQVLDVQGHSPEWKRMNVNKNEEADTAYDDTPGTQIILGETVPKPKKRPRAGVTFKYATLAIQGRGRGITLVDTTRRRSKPVVTAG